jgi:hypothetical protein
LFCLGQHGNRTSARTKSTIESQSGLIGLLSSFLDIRVVLMRAMMDDGRATRWFTSSACHALAVALQADAVVTMKSHPKCHAVHRSCGRQCRVFVGALFRVVTTNFEAWLRQIALPVSFTEPRNGTQHEHQAKSTKQESK